MIRPRKIVIALAVLLAVIMLAANYLASTFINLEAVNRKIEAVVSERTGGSIEYQSINLSIFPSTHAVINGANISVPGRVTGTAESLNIYPKIWPLFFGELMLDEIRIQSPDITMMLSPGAGGVSGSEKPPVIERMKEAATALFAYLASEAPELVVAVDNGKIALSREGEEAVVLQHVRSEIVLPLEDFAFTMSATSNVWSSMSVRAGFNSRKKEFEGNIELEQLRPDIISGHFSSDTGWRFEESLVNLNARFHADALMNLRGEIESSLLDVTVLHGDKKLFVKGKNLKSAFRLDEEMTSIFLSRLDLDQPRLSASGELRVGKKVPQISLKLEGENMDVKSAREAALAVGGDIPAVRNIFNIVRDGTIPEITFQSTGSTADELDNAENFMITGRLRKGNIFVPGPDLNLENVNGDVVISEGLLQGKNLEARLENAAGRDGELRMGVKGRDAPFHLDMKVSADLTELPPLLKRVVRHEGFVNEVSRIYNIRGKVEGRLVLGDSLQAIRVRVDISDMNLFADYQRVPYHLTVSGGQVQYDRTSVSVKNLSGKVGESSFSDMTASIDFEKDHYGEIQSTRASLDLDQIYRWLSSYESLKSGLKEFPGLSGTLNLTDVKMKGPLLKPDDWAFQGAGDVKSLVVHTSLAPAPVSVRSGKFTFNQERLSLIDNHVSMLDASIRASGGFDRYLRGLHEADIKFSGVFGPEAVEWLSNLIKMPSRLRLRSPLSFSEARFSWERGVKTSLTGDVTVRKSPDVSIDISHTPGELDLRNLTVRDEESRASLSMILKEREQAFSFEGNVNQTTMDNIFIREIVSGRWIKGNFHARVVMAEPALSSFKGTLDGEDIIFPWKLKAPLTVNRISLNAENDQVKVSSADLALANNSFSLKGEIASSEKGFTFDMDLVAERLNWDEIKDSLDVKDKDRDPEDNNLWDAPVRGTVRLSADNFTFDRFAWSTVRADIALDQQRIRAAVNQADLCGLATPGELIITAHDTSLDFRPAIAEKDVEPVFACLFGISRYMTGTFIFESGIKAAGRGKEMIEALNGDLTFLAKDGRIYQYGLLAKVLAFINITEIFRGQMPDMIEEGFAYKTTTARADIRGSKLFLKEFFIDGSSMGIASEGSIDFIQKTADLKVLVSPFKTADFIIKNVPVIRDIMGGSFVSIPVRVKGDLSNPEITYLSPADIGSGLMGVMKNVLQAPVKIIQPDIPDGEGME